VTVMEVGGERRIDLPHFTRGGRRLPKFCLPSELAEPIGRMVLDAYREAATRDADFWSPDPPSRSFIAHSVHSRCEKAEKCCPAGGSQYQIDESDHWPQARLPDPPRRQRRVPD